VTDLNSPAPTGSERSAAAHPSGRRDKRSVRGIIVTVSSVCVAAAVVLGATAWVGMHALTAKSSLEEAQTLVGTLKVQATTLDFVGLGETSRRLSAATQTAADATHDPVWNAAEFVPFAGANLKAVRQLAEAVHSVAQNGVAPLARVASSLSIDSLKPVDGHINLEPMVQLSGAMGPAADVIGAAATSVDGIKLDGTISQVSDAGEKLKGMLHGAKAQMASLRTIVQVAPDMLGASGPRTYLLMFQNLAETTALGGTSAALSEITVDNGAISITRQASSQDFAVQDGNPIIPEDAMLAALYDPMFYTRLNLATSRPDFPTAARITQAFWDKNIGGTVDGVISIDPKALSYVLSATGPVTMSTGDVLTDQNAVSLLLNEIYFRYQGKDGPDQTDAFFAEAARTIFSALMSTNAEPTKLLASAMKGVNEHRIMAWSANPQEQQLIAGTALAGILPTTNDATTTTGVFFRDMSASKMSYYLETAARLTTDVCTAPTPTFTSSVDLHSKLTTEQAANLPSYVASGPWGGKKFRTQVFVYGPPGTTVASSSVDVSGIETTLGGTSTDLGRPVVWFWVYLAPGQSSTVTATFTGAEGRYASPALRTTPMVNPTAVTVDAPGCGK
jgi:hypothetical protein